MTDHRCKISDSRTLVLESVVMLPPEVCPHCRAAWPGWHGDDLLRTCLYCGEDWIRPLAVTGDRG